MTGPIDVHVFPTEPARVVANESLLGVDARSITVPLWEGLAPDFAHQPPRGTIEGHVLGEELLPPVGPNTFWYGEVIEIQPNLFTAGPRQPLGARMRRRNEAIWGNPGQGHASNAYAIDVYPSVIRGIYVFGGIATSTFTGTLENGIIDPTFSHLGVRTDLRGTENATISGEDLTFTHELSERLRITVVDPPLAAGVTIATLYPSASDAGVIQLAAREGDARVTFEAPVPPLTGLLAGASYGAAVQLAEDDYGRLSFIEKRTTSLSLRIDDMLPPPSNITRNERTIGATMPAGTNLYRFESYLLRVRPLWRINLLGRSPASITLPELPADAAVPDLLAATIMAEAFDVPGFEPNECRFLDIQNRLARGSQLSVP